MSIGKNSFRANGLKVATRGESACSPQSRGAWDSGRTGAVSNGPGGGIANCAVKAQIGQRPFGKTRIGVHPLGYDFSTRQPSCSCYSPLRQSRRCAGGGCPSREVRRRPRQFSVYFLRRANRREDVFRDCGITEPRHRLDQREPVSLDDGEVEHAAAAAFPPMLELSRNRAIRVSGPSCAYRARRNRRFPSRPRGFRC